MRKATARALAAERAKKKLRRTTKRAESRMHRESLASLAELRASGDPQMIAAFAAGSATRGMLAPTTAPRPSDGELALARSILCCSNIDHWDGLDMGDADWWKRLARHTLCCTVEAHFERRFEANRRNALRSVGPAA